MYAVKKRNIKKSNIKSKLNKNTENVEVIGSPDTMLLTIIISLAIFGIMSVFSAGAPEGAEVYGNPGYFALKHLTAIAIGTGVLIIMSLIDYRKLKVWSVPIAVVVIALTIATLIPGIGKTDFGSSRWLLGLPIQPSEFTKITAIFLVASALTDSKNLLNRKMIENLSLVGLMIVIVLQQPNLSIAVILTLITICLLLTGGASFRLIGGFSLGIVSIPLILGFQNIIHGYQIKRITGWLDPWSDPQGIGYNIIQSLYAIGSGGLFGTGYGMSRQKLFLLPFCYTDFIFAIICEEFGFVGALLLIGLFLAFVYRGFFIANRCTNRFGTLLAFGITFSIALQAFINIGVATGVLPVTGITLPLISHGGTSVVITMAMFGILLNISKKRTKKLSPV